jgi:hypothetical protein
MPTPSSLRCPHLSPSPTWPDAWPVIGLTPLQIGADGTISPGPGPLVARGADKGNVSTSLKGLEAKGLVTITRTPGGRAEAVDLTAEGRPRVAALRGSCE